MSKKLISTVVTSSLIFGVGIAGTLGENVSSAAQKTTTAKVAMQPAQACYVPPVPAAQKEIPPKVPSTFSELVKFFTEAGLG